MECKTKVEYSLLLECLSLELFMIHVIKIGIQVKIFRALHCC